MLFAHRKKPLSASICAVPEQRGGTRHGRSDSLDCQTGMTSGSSSRGFPSGFLGDNLDPEELSNPSRRRVSELLRRRTAGISSSTSFGVEEGRFRAPVPVISCRMVFGRISTWLATRRRSWGRDCCCSSSSSFAFFMETLDGMNFLATRRSSLAAYSAAPSFGARAWSCSLVLGGAVRMAASCDCRPRNMAAGGTEEQVSTRTGRRGRWFPKSTKPSGS
mmetsp:Transcript_63218/g.188390  ORF Transcript_63218/g.188390 Transcript_63218/m.188390 type:complete len:219 (-) Transcript_63218:4-660(-)